MFSKAMESQASLLVIITFFLLSLLHWLAKYYYFKPKTNLTHRLPPGPKKLPLIGNLHQLGGSLPHHSLAKLARKYGPLMHLRLGEIPVVVVSSAKMAKEIMKTHDVSFVQRPQLYPAQIFAYGATDIAFAPYGDYWRQMRKICVTELLSSKRVQSLSFIREDETTKLIESIRALAGSNSPINLTSRIASLISVSIVRAAFGNKCKEREEFIYLAKKVIAGTGGFELADLFPSIKCLNLVTGRKNRLEKLHKKVDKVLENIVREHQEENMRKLEGRDEAEEDLVDVLLRVQQSDSLEIKITKDNIKAVIMDVFSAGTDTSASTLEWAMTEIVRNPKVMVKAQAELRQAFKGKKIIHETDLEELHYLKLVLKETLRLHPPTPLLIPRECSELTIIDGYEIPTKTRVMVNVWALGRDPQYWANAERFIPERFDGSSIDFKGNNFEYLPFGAGRRMCPGMVFGLASIMFPLAMLLYHFNWELPDGMKPQDMDMTEYFGLAVGRKCELRLVPVVYDV